MSLRRIEVLLFAGIRHELGRDRVEVEVDEPVCVAGVIEALARTFPAVAEALRACRVAVDQQFAQPEDPVPERVEVAVIPPVSGGHDGPPTELARGGCRLTSQVLVEAEAAASVAGDDCGGLVTFAGRVRGNSRGKAILHLEYEAYAPMAVAAMVQIARGIESQIGGARLAIHHRVGRLGVGEIAVIVVAAAAHRDEAFRAAREAIEALKRDVPIWKREVATDGTTWFGRGP